ncbi:MULTISPECIES: GNAT family N-acetyltransferase [Pseudomonas]|uniref:Sortase-like acyltransferase n=2 Tax=Pseudomonas asplenii TaxID=53407 RepID=A0A0N0VK22_9PSED|nr:MULTISPECIES: GNAT family N-acetyltransferase [Pseudomonas]KPA91125.1 sortase-like acyltransferase [Pseudomonas fuscovaginae]KPA97964.1 sortase-like acyltransferase [Pseudomonas fuscovaginae]
MVYSIRLARDEDAEAISQVIIQALRESNAADYPAAVIDRVEQRFGPQDVRSLLGIRSMLVAQQGERIIGTASLDGEVVRSVFVAPRAQGSGVGRALLAEVVRLAREAGVGWLKVPSTVTAEGFYARLGFEAVRDVWHGEERTIVMQLRLVA